MTTPQTHLAIDRALCGRPVRVVENEADVELTTTPAMAADAKGLVHGGFIFGAADYAAMLAVNHPHVVLGKAEVKFTAPSRVGDVVVLQAKVIASEGKKRIVEVTSRVFAGTFTCIIPDAHS
jgi:acyl-coenzyme A thioesterase PaaI-like protein